MRKQKFIRFALTEEMGADFRAMKENAENQLACKLTDARYAAMLIKWAVDRQKHA